MQDSATIADARPDNWVDRFAPRPLRPLFKLGRFDRPIGVWLLFWPCSWSVAMAGSYSLYPNLKLLGLFFAGAILMRSAGCAYNDIVDRKYDAQVERTRARPLASGQISLREAWMFLALLLLTGLLVLIQMNMFTVVLGFSSLALVATYPFMKRITYWPQLFLGLTFNWGALVAWAAVTGEIGREALYLYLGGVFWTLGYDTIYAHQDKLDDILVGVKSTALRFGENTRAWVYLFYGLAFGLFVLAGIEGGLNAVFFIGLTVVFFHFRHQIATLDIYSPALCLKIFKSNNLVGLVLFLFIWASKVMEGVI